MEYQMAGKYRFITKKLRQSIQSSVLETENLMTVLYELKTKRQLNLKSYRDRPVDEPVLSFQTTPTGWEQSNWRQGH
jgi:hypothetical protein